MSREILQVLNSARPEHHERPPVQRLDALDITLCRRDTRYDLVIGNRARISCVLSNCLVGLEPQNGPISVRIIVTQ